MKGEKMIAPDLFDTLVVKPSTTREHRLILLLSIYGKVKANQILVLDGKKIRFESKDFLAVGRFIKANKEVLADISKGSIWHCAVRAVSFPEEVENRNAIVCYTKAGNALTVKNVEHAVVFFKLKALQSRGKKQASYWAQHFRMKEKLHEFRKRTGAVQRDDQGESAGALQEVSGGVSAPTP